MYAYPFLSPVQTFGLLNAHFLVRLYFTINKDGNMGKKWLTETEGYNIITQCDVVRDTLANSPGDGIYQRFRTFPQ